MKLLFKIISLIACGIWAVSFVGFVKGEYFPTNFIIGFSLFLAATFFLKMSLEDWKIIAKRNGESNA